MPEEIEQTSMSILSGEAQSKVKDVLLGAAMQRLTMDRRSAYLDLKQSGRLKKATVINFNPTRLGVDDGHVPWKVPGCVDPHKKAITVEHGNKKYIGAYMTVEESSFVPWIRDVNKPADEGENPSAVYDPKFILPIELMDQYRIQYTNPQFITMGGVVVLEGDIHAFISKTGEIAKTIRIPDFITLPDRKRSYSTKEANTAKELAACFKMQKEYCERTCQQADFFDQTEEDRKNIVGFHRIWAQFALDMGWKSVAPDWMNARLESEEACKGCGKGKKRNDAWKCDCGRFYNPLAAYLAGEDVPMAYIYALTGKDLELAKAEAARRKKIEADFGKLN